MSNEISPGRHVSNLQVNGVERSYVLHIPQGYDGATPLPLVAMLHGRSGNAEVAERRYGFVELAATEVFLLCYPEALCDRENEPCWNAAFNLGQQGDDIAFLTALLQHLRETLNIDLKRIYLCGHSSGAMMTYRFAAECGTDLAAIGAVAGSIGSDYNHIFSMRVSPPICPISLITVHGKADQTVGYDWRTEQEEPIFHFVPAPESVRHFVEGNGIIVAPESEELFDGNVIREVHSGGAQGTEVVFYTIVDGNHKWPGGTYNQDEESSSGPANQQLNATTLLWEFFKSHSKP